MLFIQHQRLAHVFQIVLFRPVDVPLSLGLFGFHIHYAAELVLFLKKFMDGGGMLRN